METTTIEPETMTALGIVFGKNERNKIAADIGAMTVELDKYAHGGWYAYVHQKAGKRLRHDVDVQVFGHGDTAEDALRDALPKLAEAAMMAAKFSIALEAAMGAGK